ncbi:MAG: hypothetical protein JXR78_14280 [Victivallales bacterium]|nr:hypothetical protein [Victivallales bacterium]
MFTNPRWLEDAVFYEIYPQSFYDTNGDGIGDLPGVIQKLDYIKSLGVNAIWLNPCFESPFQDAGYDVSDFRKVAARYGSNDDLKELFDRAHAMGMKVILDLVAGHTSVEHPWFQESMQAEKNKYSNYYIWTDNWTEGDDKYKFINGYSPRNGNFMINFFYCQPALNYGFRDPDPEKPWQLPCDHPDVIAVREEMRDIMRFWLDMGADGFRVDMASSLVRGDNKAQGIKEIWEDYRSWMDENYPEAVLVSEWSHPADAVNVGFHIDFMVHFNLPGYSSLLRCEKYRVPNSPFPAGNSFFDREGKGDAKLFADELLGQLEAIKGRGYVSVPTGNHDIGRIRQGRDLDELKVIYAFLLTLPGVPFIYYGDEIGMDYIEGLQSKEGGYNRTGARTPMQWDNSANAGFSSAAASELYLPVDASPDRTTVAAQEQPEDSLLNTVRKMIAIRRTNPALASDGDFEVLFAETGKYPFVYARSLAGKKFVIAVNPSGNIVSEDISCSGSALTEVLCSGCAVEAVGDVFRLNMQAVSYGIYSIE